ncbi:hypothetical protein MIND_01256200 [Mycena indigotica]|uniref:Beta-lactamase-related domain-containing protein n=1 Tax=Mycena indigotica TaxID=2126181 RepID=A0A8H6S4F7_9AGAR|nr:uncharacterized protein MIND_01256200 [Mycena indigotica]KAF7291130.1 hypothetical protein MIND_01256200 [Mycena indigotica]
MLSSVDPVKLERILKEGVDNGALPASFVAIGDAEGNLISCAAGNRLLNNPASGSIGDDTIFWICSQTKLVTSIALLQLVEAGKISLDTPVAQVLFELRNPVLVLAHDESGKIASTAPVRGNITMGQLLNHTSGLDYSIDGKQDTTAPWFGVHATFTHNYTGDGIQKFFELIKGDLPGVPLRFEPGSDWAYGFGHDCAGFVVERLSGKSLEQYFQDHIFSPLGITTASFKLSQATKEKLMQLSLRKADGSMELLDIPSFHDEQSTVHFGGLGLYSSQKDYTRLLQHLLQIKLGKATKPILSQSSVDSLFIPTLTSAGAANNNNNNKPIWSHMWVLGDDKRG